MANCYDFSLNLTAEKTRRIYEGNGRYILVNSDAGQRLKLPAGNFRRFVSANGIHGRFRVEVDDENRIVELKRVD